MKVGQIVLCDYGVYRPDARGKHHVDGHIPPEMIKPRLAVVLNTKLGPAYVLVPLSKTHDKSKEARGYHVKINPDLVPEVGHWRSCDRWAKAELMQHVSADRVRTLRNDDGHYIAPLLPREVVALIQRAVMKTIGGTSLLVLETVTPPVSDPMLGAPGVAAPAHEGTV